MNRLFLTLLALIVTFPAFAQTRNELYDKFDNAVTQHDSATTAAIMTEWEKLYPDDAELFSVRANYYYMNAVEEMVALSKEKPTDGREYYVMEDSLGEEAYMYSEHMVDTAKVSTAQAILADGITKHPNRLDFRLGKIALHLKMAENTLAVQEITSALEQSITNGNKWCTTLDAPVETDGISFLRECIQTYFMQLISADDLPSAENIVNTCLHFYPQDAIFLTDKGTLRFFAGDLPAALQWYMAANKISPDDMLIVNNIANIYEKMGDNENALKYYHIVAGSNDEYYAEKAMQAIKELNAK